MSLWTWESKLEDPYEKQIYKKIFNLTKSKTLALKASKNLGLFEFLKKNKFSTSKELRDSIFLKHGKKLFDEKQAKTVWQFFNTIPRQSGGTETELQTSSHKSENAYDALIERWLVFAYHFLPETIQEIFDSVEPYAFPLREEPGKEGIITKLPVIGSVINFTLDIVGQNNKLAAKIAQQSTPVIAGFIPIPESSTLGLIFGYMISTIFIFFNLLIFVSKHELGQAFTQSLALFPLIGTTLQNTAESGEKIVEKFSKRRQKMIDALKSSPFAFLGEFIENYTLDPLYNGDPQADAISFKEKLKSGFTHVSANVKKAFDPDGRRELLSQAHEQLQELKTDPQLQSLKTRAEESLNDYPKVKQIKDAKSRAEGVRTYATRGSRLPVSNTTTEPVRERIPRGNTSGGGEKRLSKKKHKNKKWNNSNYK